MSAVDVIKRRAKPYTLTRPTTPTIVDGISTPGTPASIDIMAVIQTMTPKQVRNLPPGQNSGEWVNIWTESVIKINDKVSFRSVNFSVQRVALWEDGPFYIANATYTEDVLT